MNDRDRHGPIRLLLEAGSGIAGSVVSAAIGLVLGDAGGAVVGAAVGSTVTYSLSDVADRVLSQRERVRVGAAAAYAAVRLEALLKDGYELRADGFFAQDPDGRSAGSEIAEGVLLAARTAFEERKVRHIGYLLANVAVMPEIDAALASAQLSAGERLTWRQLVLLEVIGRQGDGDLELTAGEFRAPGGSWLEWGVFTDLIELDSGAYVTGKPEQTPRMNLKLPSTQMPKLMLTDKGTLLRILLSLDEVAQEDVDEVVRLLDDGTARLAAMTGTTEGRSPTAE